MIATRTDNRVAPGASRRATGPSRGFPRRLLARAAAAATAGIAAASLASAQRIACTEQAFVDAVRNACPAGNTTITFNCSDTTILISQSSPRDDRTVWCDNVAIDGEDRNITFRLDPPCDQGNETGCTDVEGGAWLVSLKGNQGLVRNLTVDSFFEGIHAGAGFGNTVERVAFRRPCDDAFTNIEGATGTVFRQNQIRNACDKAIQVYGRDIATTQGLDPSDPRYFDLQVLDNEFVDCKQPMRTTVHGRFLVQGNVVRVEDSQGGLYSCDGPRFSGTGIAVYFEDNRVEGCRRGLRAYESVHLVATGNVFRDAGLRGAAIFGSARASLEGNRFENNGGSTSTEAFYGGLSVAESALVDAGGGSLTIDGRARASQGRNVFLGNRSASDATLDLENKTSGRVLAESNYWGDGDPSDQVQGDVDFTPWLSEDPGQGNLPPAAPQNLRRTDRR